MKTDFGGFEEAVSFQQPLELTVHFHLCLTSVFVAKCKHYKMPNISGDLIQKEMEAGDALHPGVLTAGKTGVHMRIQLEIFCWRESSLGIIWNEKAAARE